MFTFLKKINVSEIKLIFVATLFIFLAHNQTLLDKTLHIYPFADNSIFIFALVVIFFSLLFIEVTLFCLIIPPRVVLTIFLFLSGILGYFTQQYGTIFDDTMFINVFQTDTAEALGLLNINFFVNLILLSIVPSLFIWNININFDKYLKRLLYKFIAILIAISLIVASIFSSSANFSSFAREHKVLRTYATPAYPIYSLSKIIKEFLFRSGEMEYTKVSSNVSLPIGEDGNDLVVLIVGETARADHFSLNGYHRLTNPLLMKETSLISYSNVESCGTTTTVSVPCMFSYQTSNKFDRKASAYTENILDTLAELGVNILWRDNNSDSKHVADRVTYENFKTPLLNPICDSECRDEGMLHNLDNFIENSPGNKLIVLHQMGSHGPEYYKRYPKKFEKFTPTCQTNELSKCSNEEIINAYDNTILYTDYFISKTINFLKKYNNKYEITLIYVSDHGESLGEKGIYLHGMPKNIAPKAQTNVPLLLWGGKLTDVNLLKTALIKNNSHSHDELANTLLDLFEVSSDTYDKNQSQLLYRKH